MQGQQLGRWPPGPGPQWEGGAPCGWAGMTGASPGGSCGQGQSPDSTFKCGARQVQTSQLGHAVPWSLLSIADPSLGTLTPCRHLCFFSLNGHHILML